MENINIVVNKQTRMINEIQKKIIGNDGENLQENLVFSFDDEFVNGQGRLELIMPDKTKSWITLTKVDETYQIPVKTVMTKTGKVFMQLVIDEGTDETDVPIFKSNVFYVIVNTSISAVEETPPSGYEQWIEIANAKINAIDEALVDTQEALTEANNLDLDVSKVDKTATVTLTKKDASVKTVTLNDGTSLQFMWVGTSLGIKTDNDSEYTFVNLQGIQGPPGPQGDAFTIKKTYSTIPLMVADYDNMEINDYVMIDGDIERSDNATLWVKQEEEDPTYKWHYLADFSGATGIRGETGLTPSIQIGTVVSGNAPSVTRTGTNEEPVLNFVLEKGEKGDVGNTGATGNGIVSITKTGTSGLNELVDIYTITYTNGNTSTFEVTNGEVTLEMYNKLQAKVNDLEENEPINTVTGTEINITDAHEMNIVNGELSKLIIQETTTGKNKFDTRKTATTSNGVTFTPNEDGSVTITGTATAGINVTLVNTSNPPVLSAGTYRKSIKVVGTVTKNGNYCFLTGRDNNNNNVLGDTELVSNMTTSNRATLEEEHRMTSIGVWTNAGNVVFDCTVYIQIETGETATEWEKYTGNHASPNPDYPEEIKTVTGYRNLLNLSNYTGNTISGITLTKNSDNSISINGTSTNAITLDIPIPDIELSTGKTYRIYQNNTFTGNTYAISLRDSSTNIVDTSCSLDSSISSKTFTVASNKTAKYFRIYIVTGKTIHTTIYPMIIESTQELAYAPYGTNWISIKDTNGTNTNSYAIPLRDNEIVGINTYKDELIIDKNGHCWLNKKIGKVVLDGQTVGFTNKHPTITSETKGFYQLALPSKYVGSDGATLYAKSNYFLYRNGSANNVFRLYDSGLWWEGNASFCYAILEKTSLADANDWLSTHNTIIYYRLKDTAITLIDLQYDVDLRLFKGNNTITNSEDADMSIKYVISIDDILDGKQGILSESTGYDATKTQILKNVNGTLTWVDEE